MGIEDPRHAEIGARAARLARLSRRQVMSSAPALHAPAPARRPIAGSGRGGRAARLLLAIALLGILVLAGLLAQAQQHAAALQAEVDRLQSSEARRTTQESTLDQVLHLQQDKLAGQAAQLQTTGQDMQSIQQELRDLHDRMARLDQHNAALRDALGLNSVDSAPPAGPITPTATLTPGPNGFRPGGLGGDSGPLYALVVTAPVPAPLNPADQLSGIQAQLAEISHGLDVYQEIEDNLTSAAAARVAQWSQMSEDDGTTAPPDVAAVDTPGPASPDATPPARGGRAPARGHPAPAAPVSHVPSGYPYYGEISSPFGWRGSPFVRGRVGFHKGIDIAAPMGTPVRATQAGRIIIAGWSDVYGRMVMIDHGAGWTTIYGHNSRLLVTVGQLVDQGQVLAYSGSTGMSTGPHIHYEVRYQDVPVNPAKYR